mmetsp:Transcript_10056/g.30110  ORF Transcript_10056/g.30110 Transcript_10056/m.30110 type:complete len:222 (-) Transcript_10056:209-874(-)
MRRIFGKAPEKAPAPTLDATSSRLSGRGDTLDDKIKKLDEQLIKHREAIQKLRPGPAQDNAKRRALNVLKQKRLYENQREQLYSQQYNVDQTAFMMESVQDSVQTVQAMKAAGKELKTAMKRDELDISGIERMQDDMADIMDMHNDIQEVLGQNYGVPDDIDEEELLGELDALEADMAFEAEEQAAGALPSYLQEQELPEAPQGGGHLPAEPEQGFPAMRT